MKVTVAGALVHSPPASILREKGLRVSKTVGTRKVSECTALEKIRTTIRRLSKDVGTRLGTFVGKTNIVVAVSVIHICSKFQHAVNRSVPGVVLPILAIPMPSLSAAHEAILWFCLSIATLVNDPVSLFICEKRSEK